MHTESTATATATAQPLHSGLKLAGCYILQRDISLDPAFPVWVAQDEVLGKEVSLHFIPKAVISDVRGMTELRQEVKRNRQLIHPGIVRVYDLVEDGDFPAISMDRIDGDSLNSILMRRNRLEAGEIAPWFKQLAATLDDAHRVQLFHRDLAPSNLFVKGSGQIVIAGFGISRCLRDSLERSRSISREDSHLAYMSPQQLDGDRPSKQDDVYGLGVLAFELLTGGAPFSGHDVVAAIRTASAPALSEARSVAVPEQWERFVSACMAKKADGRPASCADATALLAGSESSNASVGAMIPEPQRAPEQKVPAPLSSEQLAAPAVEPVGSPMKESEAPATKASTKTEAAAESQLPPPPPKAPSKPPGMKPRFSPNFPELERPGMRWQPVAIVALLAGIVGYAVYNKSGDPADQAGAGVSGVEEVAPNTSGSGDFKPLGTGEAENATPPAVPPKSPSDGLVGTAPGAEQPGPESEPQQKPLTEPNPKPEAGKPPVAVIQPEAVATETPKSGQGPKPPVKKPLITVWNTPATKPGDSQQPVDPASQPKPPVDSGIAVVPDGPKPPVPVPTPELGKETVAPVAPIGTTPVAALSVKLPAMPAVPAKVQIPPVADASELEKMLAERVTAEAALKGVISETEKAQQEIIKNADVTKKAQDAARKTLDERRKALAPAIRENETLMSDLKKREDELKKAEAAALEARKAAEAAKAAFEALTAGAAAKLEGAKKADEEIKALARGIADIARQGEELAKTQTQSVSLRQQAALGLQQIEKEKIMLSSALEKARAAATEAMRAKNQAAIFELVKQMQPLEAEIKKTSDVLAQLKELGDAGAAASKPIQERLDSAKKQLGKLREEAAALAGAGALEVAPEKKTEIPKAAPKRAENVENSLGMRFVKIGAVEFAVHPVTRSNFEFFAGEKGLKGGAWRSPGFAQEPDHPVVNVTWKEADAFCKWLTERERKSGAIAEEESYRLPTDLEWSMAAGLPPETGATPEERDLGIDGVFPWGGDWPPPVGAGNYAGEETNSEVRLEGYRDEYQWTSPVGKFKPNGFGLFDMGGNVWQWTADYSNATKERRALRGGSWYNGGMRQTLLSACRYASKPDEINDTYGFRVVRSAVPKTAAAKFN